MTLSDFALPPHRELKLPGVHAYTDAKSVHAGDEISLFVSSDVPYTLTVFRPERTDQDDEPDSLHSLEVTNPCVQPIHPGSYIHVPRGLEAKLGYNALTIEVWVSAWAFGRRQAIISQADFPTNVGFSLDLDEDGAVLFTLGDGQSEDVATVLRGGLLTPRTWHHLVATWDGAAISLWVDAKLVASIGCEQQFDAGPAAIRIGAVGLNGITDRLADADVAMPTIYARALGSAEVSRRHGERARHSPADRMVLASWPFHEQTGFQVRDSSGNQRTGRIVNNAAWMINAPSFDVSKVDIFGGEVPAYNPLNDATQGRAIRFARDALYDCRWTESHRLNVPRSASPGIYVARLRFQRGNGEQTYDITFIVKRAKADAGAPLLVLCSTNTWLAYATSPFPDTDEVNAIWPRRGMGLTNSDPEAPRFSSYTPHHAGQPAYYIGLKMPWPNAGPQARYDPPDANFGQWTRLELELHFWLNRHGYDYDVITDLDLHQDPALLARYKAVMVNGHSEYWSTPAYDGMDRYLRGGGAAIVLSGNTLSARVSFDDDCTIMEQRHTQLGVGFVPGTTIEYPGGKHGEQFHSQDWAKGGFIRRAGRSSAILFGLETAGWAFASAEDFGVYQVDEAEAEHFLLASPHKVRLSSKNTFGHGQDGALPRAIGHEWDLTLATMRRMGGGSPLGATMPEEQVGIQIIARGVRNVRGELDAYLDYFVRDVEPIDDVCCEMIYWERPEGGRVFNAGAVGASWVINSDEAFSDLIKNVLHYFDISKSFEANSD